MISFSKILMVLALLSFALPAAAQEDTDAAEAEGEGPPNPLELNMGEPDLAVGDIYVQETFTDWEIRCIKTESGRDPCQLYQLLDDGQGNPVSEINIFPIFDQGDAVAGATVITPLETLLTQQLSLTVDGSAARRYPFAWCAAIGCFARMGFTEAEVAQFRAGALATLIIVPVAAPDQQVRLEVSLSGFTAGYEALRERMDALRTDGN
jgi:invasion protein IalB